MDIYLFATNVKEQRFSNHKQLVSNEYHYVLYSTVQKF